MTFHRRARTMRDLRSELDDVPGVGPRRRRALLTTFGSLAGVRRATREELAARGRRESGRCGSCVFRRARPVILLSPIARHQSCPASTSPFFIAFIVLLFSLTVHEMAHAWTADRSAIRRRGCSAASRSIRSSTPIRSARCCFRWSRMVAALPLIGWAKPVPVNVSNLRHPRRDYVLVAAAGPASNSLLAFAAALALRAAADVAGRLGELERVGAARVASEREPCSSTCCWRCST